MAGQESMVCASSWPHSSGVRSIHSLAPGAYAGVNAYTFSMGLLLAYNIAIESGHNARQVGQTGTDPASSP